MLSYYFTIYLQVSTTKKGFWSPREIDNEESSPNGATSHADTNGSSKHVKPPKSPESELPPDEARRSDRRNYRSDERSEDRDGPKRPDTKSEEDATKSDDDEVRSERHKAKSKDEEDRLKKDEIASEELDKQITTRANYRTKPRDAMQTYLLGKGQFTVKHLNTKQKLSDYYVDKIPKLFFHEDKSDYAASLTGLPAHHKEFEQVLERISHLSSETQRVKADCKQKVVKTAESVVQILTKRIRPSPEYWKHYTEYFLTILKNKKQEYGEAFDEHVTDKSKLLTDRAIADNKFEVRPELEKEMEQYEKSKPFALELEDIKHEALDEFIEQQIYLPRQQFERKPSKESLKVLNDFIKEKRKEMKMDKSYQGLNVENFKLISKLLRSLTIYNHCFQLQLPLFESAPDLLSKIHENTVVTISTSTGSGM